MTLSCVKEQEELVVPDGAVTATIPFKAVVQGSDLTRASISGAFGTGSYIFQEGDRLFIVDTDTEGTDLYGVLTLIDGAGSGSGIFEGTLNCTVSPTDETELSATLVGPDAAAGFYSISGEKVTGPTYPSSIPYEAGGLAEYVKKYSHFTSSSTFGAKNFTLTQQTVFVNFNIEHIAKACLTNSSATEIGISIKSGEPLTTVRTFTGIPWAAGGNAHIGSVNFTGVFKTSDNIGSGQICVEDCTIPITSDDYNGNFDDDQTLSANRYYTVTRTFDPHWDGFKIKATKDETTVTFKFFGDEDGIQYSLDDGVTWTQYNMSNHPSILLNKGDVICWKGNRSNCDCNGTTQLFTANNVCNIAGKITSLLADPTQLSENAFRSAFSNGNSNNTNPAAVTWVNIDPNDPLILPNVTATNCYREMFRNCTSLKSVPDLPATNLSPQCYFNMFRSCINLTEAKIELPATTLAPDCYREIFRQCTQLTSVPIFHAATLDERCYQQMLAGCSNLGVVVCLASNISASNCLENWMQGIKSGGTLYTSSEGSSLFIPGTNIPDSWTVEVYSPSGE